MDVGEGRGRPPLANVGSVQSKNNAMVNTEQVAFLNMVSGYNANRTKSLPGNSNSFDTFRWVVLPLEVRERNELTNMQHNKP